MKKIFFSSVLFLLILIIVLGVNQHVMAAGSPLQISIAHPSVNCSTGVFYGISTYTFDYNGGTVTLANASDGTGDIYTDDQIDIEVTHPDTTKSTFSQDYGSTGTIVQTTPQNVTNLFITGANTVKIKMTNVRAPQCGSSAYWLVENAGGGGGATKPNILPRNTWHGDNNGVITSQTANHIVIHHTQGTNAPGNIGTFIREFSLAKAVDPAGTNNRLFIPANIINEKGDYTSIRGTWPGEIFLDWVNHTVVKGYTDIGYQYLVDPQGTIYEGRYKGGLAENADNKGQNVENGNTGVVGIALLGRYGSDPDFKSQLGSVFDGGKATPTNASIQAIQSLVNWLSSKYNINKTGTYTFTAGCQTSSCTVANISGHKDFEGLTMGHTECPGSNLYTYLPTLRGVSNNMPNGTMPLPIVPTGFYVGGFSPVTLGIVDPSGNRMGYNPATGQYVNNITNGQYGSLKLFDNESDSNDPTFILNLPTVQSGVYKVDVVGTGTGSFALGIQDLTSQNARYMSGNTTSGQQDNYQIIYNTSNPSQPELYHDTVPPVTTGTMTCSRDMNGVCRSAATFQLNATDTGTNGDLASGVAKIECSYDNKATWQQCGDANGAQIVRSTNGQFSFWYRSTDRVLNVETPKYSGVVDVEQFVSLATTALTSNLATTLQTTGIMHSNGNMSFTNNTTLHLDILNYIGTFTQSGNTTFTYNTKTQVTQSKSLPSYPLTSYKSRCTNYTGAVTLSDTGTNFNKCIYATGDVTLNTTNTSGKLTVVSEGNIKDNSTGANLQAWDTTNGVLFYTAKTYTAQANGATYTGIILAPNTQINGGLSNSTLNGGLYSKTINFNSGTSLTANQAAGFPTTTYTLPL